MGLVFRLAELLIVIVPLVGVIVAAVKAWSAANQRRAQQPMNSNDELSIASTPSLARSRSNQAAEWATITRVVEEHRRTDERWLDYELDAGRLLDYPLMTDMRDPYTTAFHKAKLRADLLRPGKAEDLLDDRDFADRYRAAVEDYVTAFNAAETEAIRRKRSDFPRVEQQRIARAKNLLSVATDGAATAHERVHAYELARKELEGLIVLPSTTQAGIERGIAGEIA